MPHVKESQASPRLKAVCQRAEKARGSRVVVLIRTRVSYRINSMALPGCHLGENSLRETAKMIESLRIMSPRRQKCRQRAERCGLLPCHSHSSCSAVLWQLE